MFDDSTGAFFPEASAQWVVATPTVKPTAVPRPTCEGALVGSIKMQGAMAQPTDTLTSRQVNSLSVLAVQGAPPRGDLAAGRPLGTVSGDAARAMISQFRLSAPVTLSGVPGALRTARFTVTLEDGKQVTYSVYNNRLVHDEASENTYYYCSPEIKMLLLSAVK